MIDALAQLLHLPPQVVSFNGRLLAHRVVLCFQELFGAFQAFGCFGKRISARGRGRNRPVQIFQQLRDPGFGNRGLRLCAPQFPSKLIPIFFHAAHACIRIFKCYLRDLQLVIGSGRQRRTTARRDWRRSLE